MALNVDQSMKLPPILEDPVSSRSSEPLPSFHSVFGQLLHLNPKPHESRCIPPRQVEDLTAVTEEEQQVKRKPYKFFSEAEKIKLLEAVQRRCIDGKVSWNVIAREEFNNTRSHTLLKNQYESMTFPQEGSPANLTEAKPQRFFSPEKTQEFINLVRNYRGNNGKINWREIAQSYPTLTPGILAKIYFNETKECPVEDFTFDDQTLLKNKIEEFKVDGKINWHEVSLMLFQGKHGPRNCQKVWDYMQQSK